MLNCIEYIDTFLTETLYMIVVTADVCVDDRLYLEDYTDAILDASEGTASDLFVTNGWIASPGSWLTIDLSKWKPCIKFWGMT